MPAPPPDFSLQDIPPPRGLRILVVEDHADSLRALERRLTRMGHTVICARSVEEALNALPRARCQILLSDIGLPDGDGWELLRRAAPFLPRPLYAVALSGYGDLSDRERSAEAGYRRHLVKPLRAAELAEVLGEAAAEYSLQQRIPAGGHI